MDANGEGEAMSEKYDGGPAFPGEYAEPYRGMSLRDWFAGQALAGLVADSSLYSTTKTEAQEAYELADAMLQERKK